MFDVGDRIKYQHEFFVILNIMYVGYTASMAYVLRRLGNKKLYQITVAEKTILEEATMATNMELALDEILKE